LGRHPARAAETFRLRLVPACGNSRFHCSHFSKAHLDTPNADQGPLVSQYLLPGALIALRAIESAALVGAALVAGEAGLALAALGRFLISAVLVLAAGVLVVGLKQAVVHRRKPMV
jgi:hypothetical protein